MSSLKKGFQNFQQGFQQTLAQTLAQTIQQTIQPLAQTVTSNSQSIKNMEAQIGQLANKLNERERGTFPSQPVPNPINQCPNQTHQVQNETINPVNAVTTLRLGKQVDNQVAIPLDHKASTSHSPPPPTLIPSLPARQDQDQKSDETQKRNQLGREFHIHHVLSLTTRHLT